MVLISLSFTATGSGHCKTLIGFQPKRKSCDLQTVRAEPFLHLSISAPFHSITLENTVSVDYGEMNLLLMSLA